MAWEIVKKYQREKIHRYIVTTENHGCFAAYTKKEAKELLKKYGNKKNDITAETIFSINEFLKLTIENNDLESIENL